MPIKNKIILYAMLFTLGILLLTIPVSAITQGEEFWNGFQYNFVESVPVWNLLNSDRPYGTNMMLFYPVDDWEIEVCSRDLTSSTVANKKSASESNFNMRLSSITTALMASKYYYVTSQETLYNLEWYIQSIDTEVVYSIYLIDSSANKFYIPNYKDIGLKPMSYNNKILPVTYTTNYTKLVIEYHVIDSTDVKTIETEIVNDKAVYE